MNVYMYIDTRAWLMMMMVLLIIPDTCFIQHVYASACACMFTLSTASTDAPSSTSTRTVSACPRELAHSNAVIPLSCEHSHVITVQRSIRLDEREHAHEYIYTCQYMHIYTHTQTSPMCIDIKKMCINTYEHICMYIYEGICSYIYLYS
jgi:hypothetical protein